MPDRTDLLTVEDFLAALTNAYHHNPTQDLRTTISYYENVWGRLLPTPSLLQRPAFFQQQLDLYGLEEPAGFDGKPLGSTTGVDAPEFAALPQVTSVKNFKLGEGKAIGDLVYDPRSLELVADLLKDYFASNLPCAMSRLGFKGVTIMVATNIYGSYYIKKADTIILSKDHVNRYGIAVLDHELLHSGMLKAKNSGLISATDYWRLRNMDVKYFSGFNGYIGKTKEEAFALGWSYAKSLTRRSGMSAVNVAKVDLYSKIVGGNRPFGKKANGQLLRAIDTRSAKVEQFKTAFTKNTEPVKIFVKSVLQKILPKLSTLCNPGAVQNPRYNNQCSRTVDLCGDNMKYTRVTQVTCNITDYIL